MVQLTQRARVAHLLRRFGLGASFEELDRLEPLGPEGALEWLLNWDRVDEGFPVSPWEFCFEEGKNEVYLDSFRPAAWWVLRMAVTQRPAQEKLALFWHNHFAVSGAKVEFGPMLVDYQEVLRQHGGGPFATLLKAVAHDPAMIQYLDVFASIKGAPNENFAREVMELFTLGRGNYTERDVQEASRAFTGWGNRFLLFEGGFEGYQEKARDAMAKGRPMVAFAISPQLMDKGTKTILGQEKQFTGDDVLEMLAAHPATAKRISRRLWEFYAYENPEPAVVERIAGVFTNSKGNIRAVLRAIGQAPEFWSERSLRRQVKSPVDFVISMTRQVNLRAFLMPLHQPKGSPITPLAQPIRDISSYLTFVMQQMGLLVLFPPNVGGWEWGKAWTTSATMAHRIGLADILFNPDDANSQLAQGIATLLSARRARKTSAEFVEGVLELFDADVPAEKRQLMIDAFDRAGGITTLTDRAKAAAAMRAVARLLFASPEFQLC